jgi:hypothetical protein
MAPAGPCSSSQTNPPPNRPDFASFDNRLAIVARLLPSSLLVLLQPPSVPSTPPLLPDPLHIRPLPAAEPPLLIPTRTSAHIAAFLYTFRRLHSALAAVLADLLTSDAFQSTRAVDACPLSHRHVVIVPIVSPCVPVRDPHSTPYSCSSPPPVLSSSPCISASSSRLPSRAVIHRQAAFAIASFFANALIEPLHSPLMTSPPAIILLLRPQAGAGR